ncbi:MAG: hypothetical protein AAF850_04770 [Pseudomonadota bacterium]
MRLGDFFCNKSVDGSSSIGALNVAGRPPGYDAADEGTPAVLRVDQNKTLHGTGAGQVALDPAFVAKHTLTDRQAQCASLLIAGVHPSDLAVELGIAPSTAEKHIAALREKVGAPDTLSLCAMMASRRTSEQEIAFGCWNPVLSPEAEVGDRSKLAGQLQTASTINAQLRHLRNYLSPYGVRHIYYAFVPLSVRGFLANDVWDCFEAPPALQESFFAAGGLAAQPMALSLFNAPSEIASMTFTEENALPEHARPFATACRAYDVAAAVAFGFPSGGGFTGFALTLGDKDGIAPIKRHADEIRSAGMLVHGAAITGGTLAAMADLTIRERDALSALARGLETSAAAEEMKLSIRAFGKLTASARRKLKAKTTASAIYKASALNALVFL